MNVLKLCPLEVLRRGEKNLCTKNKRNESLFDRDARFFGSCLVLSFDKKVAFFKNVHFFLPAVFMVAVPF